MQRITPKRSNKKIIISIIAVLLVSAAAAYAYYLIDQKNREVATREYGSPSTKPSSNTPDSSDNASGGSTSTPKDDQNDTETMPQPDQSVAPTSPSGTFVSNHTPNLDGSPRPNTINSTCTTTPGANCYVEFTMGSVRHTLASQKTDSNGNTVWNWKLSDIGLTEGTWTVTAVATNGSKESRTVDQVKLEIES